MPARTGLSTQLKIGLAFGALALVTFGIVAWVSGMRAREQVMADTGASLVELASRLGSALDTGMFERYREIQNIAHLGQLHGAGIDTARWRAIVDQLQDSFSHYAWIGVTDTDGRVLAATDGVLEGRDVSQRPWFVQGLSGPFVGDVHDAVLLASLLPASARTEPLRLVDVAAPLRRNGEVAGVLGAHLSWRWAEELRLHVLRPIESSRGVDIIVINGQGERLLGPAQIGGNGLRTERVRALLEASAHFALEDWVDGRYLTAAVATTGHLSYPGLGWTVLVRQPEATAVAPAVALQWRIGLIGLAGSLLFALSGWWLAGRISAPLRQVARRAEALAADGLPADEVLASENEVTQLSRALGTLVARLRERERDLLGLNETLEQRVQARTLALQVANDDLQAFSRTVSHDLKGPIGSLGAAARHIAEQARDRLEHRVVDMLDLMGGECDRLVHLVDELLSLSRLDQRALTRESIDLDEMVNGVITQVMNEPGAPARDAVEFSVQPLPKVTADPVLLRQVWHNLIANAVKFSARRSLARVEIGVSQGDREWVFQVADNGAGFDMRLYGRLFGVFERLHASAEFPGTGVGLSIVKRVITRHGGRVWAESAPGEGARFHFSLPFGA